MTTKMTMSGKVVCITGAAGGIGGAIAQVFAHNGAHLVLLDQHEDGLSRLTTSLALSEDQRVQAVVADLRTEQCVKQAIQQGLASFNGRIDVLVANVGVLVAGPFLTLTAQDWQQAFTINLLSHVFACQEVVPRMQQQGWGAIILMGSDQGVQPDATLSPYASAKAALHAFGKVLAREQSPTIRVNVVAPGMTRTPLVETLMQGYAREFGTDAETAERQELQRRGVPLARLAEPEEVAQAVLYLASATFCTGTILNVSGGNLRGIAS